MALLRQMARLTMAADKAPSDLDYYLLTSEIFDILAETKSGWGAEVQLTDAIDILNEA